MKLNQLRKLLVKGRNVQELKHQKCMYWIKFVNYATFNNTKLYC